MSTPPLEITPQTSLHALIEAYPFLREFQPAYCPTYRSNVGGIAFRVRGRIVNLGLAAQEDDVPVSRLIDDIADEVEKQAGTRPSVSYPTFVEEGAEAEKEPGADEPGAEEPGAEEEARPARTWTREALLSEYRARPKKAASAAFHPDGFAWVYDKTLDKERYFRWPADQMYWLEDGLPTDPHVLEHVLLHEVASTAVPDDGWQHHSGCTCRTCYGFGWRAADAAVDRGCAGCGSGCLLALALPVVAAVSTWGLTWRRGARRS